MKLAFFGTPQFAAVALQRLIDSHHRIALVVTQPDKPTGRGRKIAPPPVKELALSAGLAVEQPASVKKPEFADRIRGLELDAAIVVAYGRILPAPLLTIPRFGFLNIHGSLLPKYRGAAPIQWAVARGERQTGVSIMQVEEGLDSGPVIDEVAVDILDDDDARSVHDILAFTGADLLLRTLDEIERTGRVESVAQDHALATHAPIIKREDARIDWNRSAEEVVCLVRGFVLWPGAYAEKDGVEIKFLGAEAASPDWVDAPWKSERIPVGAVVDVVKGRGFVVKTGDGLVLVTRIKPAGKKEMDADSAMNGGLVAVGTLFK